MVKVGTLEERARGEARRRDAEAAVAPAVRAIPESTTSGGRGAIGRAVADSGLADAITMQRLLVVERLRWGHQGLLRQAIEQLTTLVLAQQKIGSTATELENLLAAVNEATLGGAGGM